MRDGRDVFDDFCKSLANVVFKKEQRHSTVQSFLKGSN